MRHTLGSVAMPGTPTTRREPLTLANIEASALASTRAMRELLHLLHLLHLR